MNTVIPTKCFQDLDVLLVDLVMINVTLSMAFFENFEIKFKLQHSGTP